MSYTHIIQWISADGQSTIDESGEYETADREGAIRDAAYELLRQCCSEEEHRAGILAGTIDGETVASIIA